jgi:hypothetical protein
MAKNSSNILALGVGLNLDPLNQDIANAAKTAKDGMATIGDSIAGAGGKADKPLKDTKDKIQSLGQQARQATLDAQQMSIKFGLASEQFKESAIAAARAKDQIVEVNSAILANSTTMNNVSQPAFAAHKNGYNGMAMSINQLTREMPAFTYSMQTGFMAISNNIPMFVDQINLAKRANMELMASGQPVKSVFSQVASSLFSFQTLMGVGITILTVYGAKIYEWLTAEKEVNIVVQRSVELEKQYSEMIAKSKYELEQKTVALRDQLAALQQGISVDEIQIKNKEAQVNAFNALIAKNNEYNDSIAAHNEEMRMRKAAIGSAGDTDKQWGIVQERNNQGLIAKVQLLKDEIEQGKIQLGISKQIENIKDVNKGVKEKPEIISHIIKIQYTKENAGLGDFKVNVPALPQLKLKATFTDEGLTAAMINTKIKIIQGFADIKNSLETSIGSTFGSVGQAIGDSLAASLSGEQTDMMDAVGVAIVKSLGQMAVQVGSMLIAMSVPMIIAGIPQGYAYALAGTGLIAVGATVSGLAGRKSQSAPMPTNNTPTSNMSPNSNYIGGNNSGQLVIQGYVRGNDINFVNGKSGSKNNRNLRFG